MDSDQNGFTIGSVVMLILLVVVIIFCARFIGGATKDTNDQATKLDSAFGNNQPENDPSDDDYIPDSPDSGAEEVDIRSVQVLVDVAYVTLVAKLPGTYTGKCFAEVTNLSGEDYHRYVEALDRQHECKITVPRNGGEEGYKFKMSYQSDDGKYFGSHPQETFTF